MLDTHLFFFTSITSLYFLWQTLTTLNLEGNQVKDAGAQVVGQALEINQVRYIYNFVSSIVSLLYLLQTLTTLNLERNGIRDTGAQAIGQALERNQVR